MNPPFSLLPRVVKKIQEDGAHGVLIVPEWAWSRWHKQLIHFRQADILIPRGSRIFELAWQICRGTRWPTRAILVCGHTPPCTTPLPTIYASKEDCSPPKRHCNSRQQSSSSKGQFKKQTQDVCALSLHTPNDPPLETHRNPRALDLFSGNGSWKDVLVKNGFDVVSLDLNPKNEPDICMNVLHWEYWKEYRENNLT